MYEIYTGKNDEYKNGNGITRNELNRRLLLNVIVSEKVKEIENIKEIDEELQKDIDDAVTILYHLAEKLSGMYIHARGIMSDTEK
jgi:hypothetical protein